MNKPIKLPILFETAETMRLQELDIDIDYSLHDLEVRTLNFFVITATGEVVNPETGDKQTQIFSSGEVFLCPLPEREVLRIIEESN